MPDPELFGHGDAYMLYTSYATKLEEAGLAGLFPDDARLRHIAIELLAEREPIENVQDDPTVIRDSIAEARRILTRLEQATEDDWVEP